MEHAQIMEIQADASIIGLQGHSIVYKTLGKIYLAALANSSRGKGIPIFGSIPDNVTIEELRYTTEEVRALAEENLRRAHEIDQGTDLGDEYTRETVLAMRCVEELSAGAFEAFDEYKQQQRLRELQDLSLPTDESNPEP